MLRKLLKYDLRPTFRLWRIFAPIFVFAAVIFAVLLAGLTSLTAQTDPDPAAFAFFSVMTSLFYPVLIAAVGVLFVGTLVMVLRRYIVNFCSDEGYLTFSLPIPRKTLYLSKVLSAILWDTASGILLFLAICLFLAVSGAWETTVFGLIHQFFVVWTPVLSAIGVFLLPVLFLAVEFFHVNLVYLMCGTAAGYTGRRVGAGRIVLLAVLLYYVFPVVSSVFFLPFVGSLIGFFTVAEQADAGAVSALGLAMLSGMTALFSFLGFWLYYKNVHTLETRLNLS